MHSRHPAKSGSVLRFPAPYTLVVGGLAGQGTGTTANSDSRFGAWNEHCHGGRATSTWWLRPAGPQAPSRKLQTGSTSPTAGASPGTQTQDTTLLIVVLYELVS